MSTPAATYLGIDLGTSAVKALVMDQAGRVVAQASEPLTLQRPRPGWSEQDPQEWWRATVSAVRALPAEARGRVRAVGLSGQMHGAVLLDATGQVLRPAILWNDGRSAAQCAELERLVPDLRALTGNMAMPGFTAPKLLWVREHEPECFARIATVLLPKDYLRFRFTGERLSDLSDAAGTLWVDVGRRRWADSILAATGLTRAHMPRLIEGSDLGGSLTAMAADALGLNAVPVAGGAGDNAASAVGMGLIAPGQAFLSLGTSGVLFVVNDRFAPNPDGGVHTFCHALPKLWHQMAVMLTAAGALDWASALCGYRDIPDAVAAASARGLQAQTPLFLPYLHGERTPHNDVSARGTFFRLTPETSAADLLVAVLEGVAHAFADCLGVLEAAGGRVGEICVVGGGARVAYWLELLAAALQRPLTLRAASEVGAALGAARLAQLAASGAAPESVCRPGDLVRTIDPDPALVRRIGARHPTFVELYRVLKPLYQEFPT